jgi:hypothetical protein
MALDEQTAGMLVFCIFCAAFMAGTYLSCWMRDLKKERMRRQRRWW